MFKLFNRKYTIVSVLTLLSVIGASLVSASSPSSPARRRFKPVSKPYSYKKKAYYSKFNNTEKYGLNKARASAQGDAEARARNRNANRNRSGASASIEESPITANVTSPQTVTQNQLAIQTCQCISSGGGAQLPPTEVIASAFSFIASADAPDVGDGEPVLFPPPVQQTEIDFDGDAGIFRIVHAGTYLIEFTIRGIALETGSPDPAIPILFALTNGGTFIPGSLYASDLEDTGAETGKARTITGHVTVELLAGATIQVRNRSGATFRPGSLAAGADSVTTESIRITQKPAEALRPS